MISTKQQIVIGSLKDAFERRKHEKWIQSLMPQKWYYKLAIEVGELGQKNKGINLGTKI